MGLRPMPPPVAPSYPLRMRGLRVGPRLPEWANVGARGRKSTRAGFFGLGRLPVGLLSSMSVGPIGPPVLGGARLVPQ